MNDDGLSGGVDRQKFAGLRQFDVGAGGTPARSAAADIGRNDLAAYRWSGIDAAEAGSPHGAAGRASSAE
ncbi:MAG: hypothetical protein OXH66_16230 [Gemmatimonadetes bacterium]|nr:hypothetical protein [Gemmatimonadota bacterium]